MDEGRVVSGDREAFNFMAAASERTDRFIEMTPEYINPLVHEIDRWHMHKGRALRQADEHDGEDCLARSRRQNHHPTFSILEPGVAGLFLEGARDDFLLQRETDRLKLAGAIVVGELAFSKGNDDLSIVPCWGPMCLGAGVPLNSGKIAVLLGKAANDQGAFVEEDLDVLRHAWK